MPDQGREQHVDRGRDQLLHVGADLLQLAQRLAAALVLEHLVGQVQGVADAVGVDLRAQPLRDHVDEVVLEVLGHARDEGDADGRPAAAGSRRGRTGPSCTRCSAVAYSSMTWRKISGSSSEKTWLMVARQQRQDHQPPVLAQIGIEQLHDFEDIPPPPRSLHHHQAGIGGTVEDLHQPCQAFS